MRIGEVIGKLTLSKGDPKLCGGRFLIVQPHDAASLRSAARGTAVQAVEGHEQDARATTEDGRDARAAMGRGEVEVVYDGVGAKAGDRVGFSEGREAAMPFHPDKVAIDAYLACILDNVTYDAT